MDLEKPGSAESKKSISQEEYDAIKRDLKLVNKSIQKSGGIASLSESDFKSEIGIKKYNEFKSSASGSKGTFNKNELETIGSEMEKALSTTQIIGKEKLSEKDAQRADIEKINKLIQNSKGIIDVNESDFKSEYGRKRYHELKSIAEGKSVTFNKTELQRIGDELDGLLSGSHEEKKEDKAPEKVEPKVEDKIPEAKPEPVKESENDRIKRLAIEKARQKAGVVNVDALAEKEARYMADKHIQESKANLTGVRGFFKKFKYTFLGSYLRAKKVNQVRDDILKTGNIYAGQNIDKSEHEKAMNQVANRFIQEYEETMSKGDEKRALDAHDPVAAKAKSDVKQLIYDYAEGKISDDIFLAQKDRIINNLKSQDLLSGANNYADNLFEIAKNARVAVEHGAKLEELDLNTDFIIGRAKSAIKTEGNFGLIDNTVDKLKNSRIGRYISPAVLTTAVGLVYTGSVIGSKVARSKTAALITLGGTALLAGAIAGADKSHDLQDKIRQLRERRGRGRVNEAPDKLDEFMYNTESAEALTNNLRSLMYTTDANGELVLIPIDASNAREIMGAVAQIKALKNVNDRNNIDLISYSDVSKMEAEKTELEILTGQAREELRKQFTGNLSGMLNGANFENYLAQHVEAAEGAITGGAKGVDEQNSAFKNFKRKEVVKKALLACTVGMVVGATVQEGMAYFNPNVQGYVEGLTGHHDAHATLQTPIAQLRDLLTGNHTNIPGGGVDVHKFVHDTKEIITDAKGWINNPLNNTEHISRQTWFGNNTEMYGHAPNYAQTHEWLMRPDPQTGVMGSGANLNELQTQWGGNKGLLPNGDHVLNISHMTSGGSFQGGLSVDAQEAMKKGMLQAMISLTDGTQNHAIPVNILPNGDVIFDHNNPIMQQIFTQDPVTGQTINHARFIEIVQNLGVDAHGVKQVIPLGTLEGEGLDKIKDIVDTVKDVVTHTDTPIGMQPPFFLPTYLNKALIREKVKEIAKEKGVPSAILESGYYLNYYNGGPTEEDIKIFNRNRSKTLNENPNAKLDHYKEIKSYLDKQNPEYSSRIEKLAGQTDKMNPDCKISVCIPVAGHQEENNIYETLENYTYQTAKPEEFELVLFVNHPIKDKEGINTLNADKTLAEIERFKNAHPEMNVRVMYEAIPNEEVNIGKIRKMLTDATLLRQQERGENSPDLIIVSNDADNKGVSPDYLKTFIKQFEKNSDVDGYLGQLDWDPESYQKYPAIHIGTRLFQFLNTIGRYKSGGMSSSGANTAFRSSIYAGIGGYIDKKGGEDIAIRQAIIAARGNNSYFDYAGPRTRLFTSSRRSIAAWKDGLPPIDQWPSDNEKIGFSAFNDEIRKYAMEDGNDVDYNNPETQNKLKKEIEAVINLTLDIYEKGEKLGKDSSYYRKALSAMGIKYYLDDKGNVVIHNMPTLIKNLKDYQIEGKLIRDAKSGKPEAIKMLKQVKEAKKIREKEEKDKLPKVKKEIEPSNNEKFEKGVEIFLDKYKTSTEKINSMNKVLDKSLNDESLQKIGLNTSVSEIKAKLEECKNIDDPAEFMKKVKNILRPIGLSMDEHNEEFGDFQRKAFVEYFNFTPINEAVSYRIDNGDLHIHLAPVSDFSTLKKIKLFRDAFKKLKEIVISHPEVQIISATSPLVTNSPGLLKAAGFKIEGPVSEEIRKRDFDGEKGVVSRATMTREEALAKTIR